MHRAPGISERQARGLLEKQMFSDVLTNRV
jgi:hypothetical protein